MTPPDIDASNGTKSHTLIRTPETKSVCVRESEKEREREREREREERERRERE